MRFEIAEDQKTANAWRVEVIDQDGLSYTAYFVGPQAQQRAHGFAERKKSSMKMMSQRAA